MSKLYCINCHKPIGVCKCGTTTYVEISEDNKYINPNWWYQQEEDKIMQNLIDAFNKFSQLERQHPNELNDFIDGIHKCQYVLAMRYAREYRPDVFPVKE